ncbi:ANTAR domain-containing response regulator [Paraferrimonas sp. SM1919]|uniref:ANTAR domain-containing response regulator n=1 Tax=Paraferrimonas sp. SM1919 TaxID=2662263 RepID=UPI0013D4EDA4|nr:ANTAR domain-containing protein [Paraferrimonas sp. SM1919]
MLKQHRLEQDLIKILFIENKAGGALDINKSLEQSHYRIVRVCKSGLALLKEVENFMPDIILIDIESPDRDMIESLHSISQTAPKPVVMFSEHDDQDTIERLVECGVSAYVVGSIEQVRLKSVLDIALARFKHFQSLQQELQQTKQQLNSQSNIDKAKCWLMETKNLSEDAAYHSIRKMAMNSGQKIDQAAQNVLSVAAMLKAEL